MRDFARVRLLILDDWGSEPLNAERRRDLLEIVEDRWHELIGDSTLGNAILDSILHNAYRIDLTGDSMRKPRCQPALADGE